MTHEDVRVWWLSQPGTRIEPTYYKGHVLSGIHQFWKDDVWVATSRESRNVVFCVDWYGQKGW